MNRISIELEIKIYRKLESLVQGFNESPAQVIERLADNALGNKIQQRTKIQPRNNYSVPRDTNSEFERIYPWAYGIFEASLISRADEKRALNNALNKLEEAGIHRGSARMYIGAYFCMKKGERYTMSINMEATRYFIMQIKGEDNLESLEAALESLSKHIEYRRSNNINNPGLESIHEEFSAELKKPKETGKKPITIVEIEKIYPLAKNVYEGKKELNDAVETLKTVAGMNPTSAKIYIGFFLKLKKGELHRNKMTANSKAVDYFLKQILANDGKGGLETALDSLCQHIEYRKRQRLNDRGYPEIYAKFLQLYSKQ